MFTKEMYHKFYVMKLIKHVLQDTRTMEKIADEAGFSVGTLSSFVNEHSQLEPWNFYGLVLVYYKEITEFYFISEKEKEDFASVNN